MRRNTVQREIISEVVEKMSDHATANEIYEKIIENYPSIGKSTVIRNLDRLCDQGKLAKRPVPDGPCVYDPICTDHYHVKCTECGHIFDVDMSYMSNLESSIHDKRGFIFTGHEITFSGICPDCQKKQDESSR